jgi:hypothetical protein
MGSPSKPLSSSPTPFAKTPKQRKANAKPTFVQREDELVKKFGASGQEELRRRSPEKVLGGDKVTHAKAVREEVHGDMKLLGGRLGVEVRDREAFGDQRVE